MSLHKYGVIHFDGAKVGDAVRFVPSPSPGKPGAILRPRSRHDINGVLRSVRESQGYVEILPQLSTARPSAYSEAGSASGINVSLNVAVSGKLKIT